MGQWRYFRVYLGTKASPHRDNLLIRAQQARAATHAHAK